MKNVHNDDNLQPSTVGTGELKRKADSEMSVWWKEGGEKTLKDSMWWYVAKEGFDVRKLGNKYENKSIPLEPFFTGIQRSALSSCGRSLCLVRDSRAGISHTI